MTDSPTDEATRPRVRMITVDERGDGQRVDNFVLRECPSVPKTRLYKAMRKGEIRVNKGRVKPEHRVHLGDIVRLPPLAVPSNAPKSVAPQGWQERLERSIIFEDEFLMAINKPSGLAVHGGSGLNFGMIETLRVMRDDLRFLELVHRLDRDTSGLILVAKKPGALKALHGLLRNRNGIRKRYLGLVAGRWPSHVRDVDAPLLKQERASGERIVKVAKGGQSSLTSFRIRERFAAHTLIEASPITGRTHQIRVHAQSVGFPLLGDDKYANELSIKATSVLRLKRLFLHAEQLRFKLDDRVYELKAEIDDELEGVLNKARN